MKFDFFAAFLRAAIICSRLRRAGGGGERRRRRRRCGSFVKSVSTVEQWLKSHLF